MNSGGAAHSRPPHIRVFARRHDRSPGQYRYLVHIDVGQKLGCVQIHSCIIPSSMALDADLNMLAERRPML